MFAKAQAMFIYVELYTVDCFKASSFTVLNMEKNSVSGFLFAVSNFHVL